MIALDVETKGVNTRDPRVAEFRLACVYPGDRVTYSIPKVTKAQEIIVHNIPYDPVVLDQWDGRWQDTKMLAHLNNEADSTLKGLTIRYLGRNPMTYAEAEKSGEWARYCLADAQNTYELFPVLYNALPPETRRLYDELERPLLPLWAKMTLEGEGYVDRAALLPYREALVHMKEEQEEKLAAMLPPILTVDVECAACGKRKGRVLKGERCVGGRVHKWKGGVESVAAEPPLLTSPQQVMKALAELGVYVGSTDAHELNEVKHPVVGELLSWRGMQKELTTYVEPLLEKEEGERISSLWRPTGVRNGGRVSSASPNRQNVPNHLEKYVVPGEGYRFVDADNAQLEVRVASVISQDETLLNACISTDFHGEMMKTFGLQDRRLTKVFVFGTMYLGGAGALFATAKKYGVTLSYGDCQMAQRVVRNAMPTYFRWAEAQKGLTIVKGLFGAWHEIPQVGDEMERGRQAVNDPIQGGAGRVTKWQMLKLHQAGYEVVRQVHDAVRVRVREEEYQDAKREVKRIMESACEIGVPIVVEVKE